MATQTHAPTGGITPHRSGRPDVDPKIFWSWVWQSVYPVLGYVLIGIGVIVIGFGWYGVADNAIVAKQLPYLASGGVIGLALIVVGSRFLVMQDLRRDSGRLDRLEAMVAELHETLLIGADALGVSRPAKAPSGASTYLVPDGGTHYHAEGCPIIEGKSGVSRLRPSTVTRRGLSPCPMCEPAPAEA